MRKKYWLVKSEENVYSIDNLAKDKETFWDGVRNYQARNFMRDDMKLGDLVLFYHSNSTPNGIAGICEISKEGYPDHTAFDPEDKHFDPKSNESAPTWIMVNVKFIEKFNKIIELSELKSNPKLSKMRLVQRGNRLSVMPVEKEEYEEILKMAER